MGTGYRKLGIYTWGICDKELQIDYYVRALIIDNLYIRFAQSVIQTSNFTRLTTMPRIAIVNVVIIYTVV